MLLSFIADSIWYRDDIHPLRRLRELVWQERWVDAVNVRWMDWSRRLPTGSFIMWLASCVADDMISHTIYSSTDDLLARVDKDKTHLQDDAELYLQKLFFPFSPFCAQKRRMMRVFRRLIQRRIRQFVGRRTL